MLMREQPTTRGFEQCVSSNKFKLCERSLVLLLFVVRMIKSSSS